MIDLAAETLLTLGTAAERLLVSRAIVYGWVTRGSNGIRLEAAKVGGCWRTSEEALQRFSDRLSPHPEQVADPTPPAPTPKERQRHLEEVNERLDEWLGVRKCEACRVRLEFRHVVVPKNEKLWCPPCLIKRQSATLGQRIRTFRWAASLSQQELASRTGIGVDHLRAYEFNEKPPSEAHLAKLIEVLGRELVSGLKGHPQDGVQPAAA